MSQGQRLFLLGRQAGNTASRAKGAGLAGWEVHWSRPFWGDGMPAWRRVWQYRLRDGPDVRRYNQTLLKEAVEAAPQIVWVEEPMFVYPETLEAIRRQSGATLVCAYSDDPRDPAKKSRHFEQAVGIYEVIFATKDELLQWFSDQSCRSPLKFWKGYDPERIYPITLSDEDRLKYQSEVAFIGHADFVQGRSTRLAALQALARAVPGVKIWGRTWGQVNWPADMPGVIHPYQIDGLEYTKALCATKLALQMPSRLARDTHSSRSVEIPACGVMMLAERTVDHQVLFVEDQEAVFFSSVPELVEKARYYLAHPVERERIARVGYERCLRSGYSNYERMRQMLETVMKYREGRWV